MANAKLGTKAVGSTVKLKVNGTAKEFIVVHQGKPSSLYDESCNGTWLLMKDIYENRVWNRAAINKYENSEINTYLNNTFLGLLDSNIKDVIKRVKIPYRKNGGYDGTNQSGANGLSVKIFLLSGYEVGWTTRDYNSIPVDGAKLDYFTESSSGNSKRVSHLNGVATSWWLRSPFTDDVTFVWCVDSYGNYNYLDEHSSVGVRPALILPPDMEVDSSGNVTLPPPPATHKTLVNGTAYEVKGGKCLVNGTSYDIKKGRTLIGGTGYDITFPEPLVMPVKGDLITMNLDGTNRQYRVLKIVDDTTVEVLSMESVSLQYFNHTNNGKYAGSVLDSFLDVTYYESLSARAKAAIVQKDIIQDQWTDGSSGSPTYTGTNCNPNVDYTYTISRVLSGNKTVGKRHVYALSIQSIIDYLSDKSVLAYPKQMLNHINIWNAFFGSSEGVNEKVWLMTGNPNSSYAWGLYGLYGYIYNTITSGKYSARPVFQIDLSKIAFTIN